MKFKPNSHYSTIATYAFLVIAAALLLHLGLNHIAVIASAGKAVFSFIRPVIYGFIIAFLLNPMLRLYESNVLKNKLPPKRRRIVALLMTYASVCIIVVLFFRLVIPQLVVSTQSLVDNMPQYVEFLNRFYNNMMHELENIHLSGDSDITLFLNNLQESTTSALSDLLVNLPNYVASWIPELFSAGARVTSGIINFLLGIIISIYFLAEREKLFAQTNKTCHALFSENTCRLFYEIALDANRVFSGFVTGKIIDSAIIGILCFFLMSILRMPYAVLISVIVGVTNIIPYFGPFFGAIPSTLILLFVSPMSALIFLIMILILQQFDGNILGPKILGNTVGLSPLWVIFAIMLFSGIFGIIGMFIGVPLFALLSILVRRMIIYLLHRKGLSCNTEDYSSPSNPLIR